MRITFKLIIIIIFITSSSISISGILCTRSYAQQPPLNMNIINGIFGLHWGDGRQEIEKVFKNKLRKPTKSEKNEYEGILTTGKSGNIVEHMLDSVDLYGFECDKVYLITFKGKLIEIMADIKNPGMDVFENIKRSFSSLYLVPKYDKEKKYWFWIWHKYKRECYWRKNRTRAFLYYSSFVWSEKVRFWAGGF